MIKQEIIDNFLPQDQFEFIKKILESNNFPWYFQDCVAYEGLQNEDFYFTHKIFDKIINSDFIKTIEPIIDILKPKALIRIKANFYPNLNKIVNNKIHIDYNFEHQGAIYYINTNNGFTVLEDGTKIKSIENRLFLFDASKPHYSTHCTDKKARININFNYF